MRCYDDAVRVIIGLVVILFAHLAWADDAGERAAIANVITSLNNQSSPISDLFTSDVPDIDRAFLSEEPWSEVTRPQIAIRSIRFLTAITALVEAENVQYGSLVMKRRESMLLLVRKYGSRWRIACVLAQNPK